jgi:hypothetical protein
MGIGTTRAKFPTVISAKLFGFKEEPYFKAEEGATQGRLRLLAEQRLHHQ